MCRKNVFIKFELSKQRGHILKILNIFMLVFMFFISGCASNKAITPTTKVANGNGIILASVTQYGAAADSWFYYKNLSENHERRMDAVGMALLGQPDDFPDDNSKIGRLSAFEVPEGEYELTRWQVYTYTTGPGYINPKKIEPIPFKVKAGEITYLGNLHIETFSAKNIFGFPVPVAGEASLLDQSKTDLPLFNLKYQNLMNMPINMSVPNLQNWGAIKNP